MKGMFATLLNFQYKNGTSFVRDDEPPCWLSFNPFPFAITHVPIISRGYIVLDLESNNVSECTILSKLQSQSQQHTTMKAWCTGILHIPLM